MSKSFWLFGSRLNIIAGVGTQDENGTPDMELAERISAEIGDEILGLPGALPPAAA